ncbi:MULTISPECIES: flagellar basal body rod protein FlgB [unclassified Variovorax]|jgi:flagellar basal-body rod protein FlgB|uniref:flagellar basal body rod protein FlgB n=1 Tax=unclassified Variovorax TaxID=663243 RepID=UPI0021BAB38F|nr:flagellar basal body protein [Variovorax sp. CY25R-8]MCT8175467.1 flagellar basal body protein [Variovorax sp. CY25R-8]
MIDGIEAVTRSALALALDAASLRQQAIATNIANANVIDYVPQRVSFEAQLLDARRGMAQTGRLDTFALSQVRPHIEPAVDADGTPQPVQLDVEAAEMARNAVHYQALVKGLSRHLSILSMAAGDGRK